MALASSTIFTGSPMSSQEDFASFSHGARLDHELRSLGNGHEIAYYLPIRDGDRPASCNLLAEPRHHRTA